MLLKLLGLVVLAYWVAKWLFRDSLRALLSKLDRRINRVVNVALIALAVVYGLRIVMLLLGIPEW